MMTFSSSYRNAFFKDIHQTDLDFLRNKNRRKIIRWKFHYTHFLVTSDFALVPVAVLCLFVLDKSWTQFSEAVSFLNMGIFSSRPIDNLLISQSASIYLCIGRLILRIWSVGVASHLTHLSYCHPVYCYAFFVNLFNIFQKERYFIINWLQ